MIFDLFRASNFLPAGMQAFRISTTLTLYRGGGLVLILLMIPVCVYTSNLNDAYKEYLSDDYEEALKKAKVLKENDETLYFLGLIYIKIGNYPQAREYLIRLSKNYPRSQFKEQGAVRFADSYFLEGDLAKAKASYEDIIKEYPSCSYMPLVYLRLAQAANKEGRWEEKNKYIGKLKEKYPQSAEARFIDSLENTEDFFTIQVGAFTNRNNALALKKELEEKYAAYIAEDKKEDYAVYKVRIGKFKDRKEAERVYGRLIKQGYPARMYP